MRPKPYERAARGNWQTLGSKLLSKARKIAEYSITIKGMEVEVRIETIKCI